MDWSRCISVMAQTSAVQHGDDDEEKYNKNK